MRLERKPSKVAVADQAQWGREGAWGQVVGDVEVRAVAVRQEAEVLREEVDVQPKKVRLLAVGQVIMPAALAAFPVAREVQVVFQVGLVVHVVFQAAREARGDFLVDREVWGRVSPESLASRLRQAT